MSATGRSFVRWQEMLSLTPLVLQQVASNDSGSRLLSAAPADGLTTDYVSMVKAAFQPKWWSSNVVVDAGSNILHTGTPRTRMSIRQMEYNFSMFWGGHPNVRSHAGIRQFRFDQFMQGNRSLLRLWTAGQWTAFTGKGGCSHCHNGGGTDRMRRFPASSRAAWLSSFPRSLGTTWASITRAASDNRRYGIAAGDP